MRISLVLDLCLIARASFGDTSLQRRVTTEFAGDRNGRIGTAIERQR